MGFDPLHDEAMRWVAHIVSDAATQSDIARAAEWRAQSAEHEAAFRRALIAWRLAGAAAVDQANAEAVRVGRRRVLRGLAAACAVGALGWGGMKAGLVPGGERPAEYATGIGEARHVVLTRRHTADLSAASAFSHEVRPDGGERVRLLRGSAFFEVAPGAELVAISAGGGKILATAGTFAVCTAPDRIIVSCRSGRATVLRQGLQEVQAGERVHFNQFGCTRPQETNPELIGAWRKGLVAIDNLPLAIAVDVINRYRPGRIILVNAQKSRLPVNRVFDVRDAAGMLDTLAAEYHLEQTRLPGGITLLS